MAPLACTTTLLTDFPPAILLSPPVTVAKISPLITVGIAPVVIAHQQAVLKLSACARMAREAKVAGIEWIALTTLGSVSMKLKHNALNLSASARMGLKKVAGIERIALTTLGSVSMKLKTQRDVLKLSACARMALEGKAAGIERIALTTLGSVSMKLKVTDVVKLSAFARMALEGKNALIERVAPTTLGTARMKDLLVCL